MGSAILTMVGSSKQLEHHLRAVRACSLCPNMVGPVVTSGPVVSRVYLCGQAPGPHEGELGRPFAWTAGKTLFKWFERVGVDEETFRRRVFMAAVCRCFPGKTKQGGDRVPSDTEVDTCRNWMEREIELLEPHLVIPVGKLAIHQFLPPSPLADLIGKQWTVTKFDHTFDLIPLPHPSGASTWFKREPGKGLLDDALKLLSKHKSWANIASL